MFALRHKLKILKSIVRRIAVLVMDYFAGRENFTVSFGYEYVLVNEAPRVCAWMVGQFY